MNERQFNWHAYRTVGGYWIAHAVDRVGGGYWARGTGEGPTEDAAKDAAKSAMHQEADAIRHGWKPEATR